MLGAIHRAPGPAVLVCSQQSKIHNRVRDCSPGTLRFGSALVLMWGLISRPLSRLPAHRKVDIERAFRS